MSVCVMCAVRVECVCVRCVWRVACVESDRVGSCAAAWCRAVVASVHPPTTPGKGPCQSPLHPYVQECVFGVSAK